jgi:hypothetical protein
MWNSAYWPVGVVSNPLSFLNTYYQALLGTGDTKMNEVWSQPPRGPGIDSGERYVYNHQVTLQGSAEAQRGHLHKSEVI